MKGGHLTGSKVIDVFYDGKKSVEIKNKQLKKEGHGTGCTLSSAVAANLAKGKNVNDTVKNAITYVHNALEKGFKVGSKNYVLNHSSK